MLLGRLFFDLGDVGFVGELVEEAVLLIRNEVADSDFAFALSVGFFFYDFTGLTFEVNDADFEDLGQFLDFFFFGFIFELLMFLEDDSAHHNADKQVRKGSNEFTQNFFPSHLLLVREQLLQFLPL